MYMEYPSTEVLLLMWSGVRMEPHHHMAEFFSGKAEVSAAFRELGKSCVSYDIEYCGKAMDYLEPGGYALLAIL